MTLKIDTALHSGRRRLRTCPEKILMDATGLRLWADYLDVAPGFTGRIDFIHKINIPSLFSVDFCKRGDEAFQKTKNYEPADVLWEPSNVCIQYDLSEIKLTEYKFITEDDIAVSCMRWKNFTGQEFEIHFRKGIVQENLKTTYDEKLSVLYFLNGEKTEVYEKVWTLKPNETVELCIAAQVCFSDESKRMEACCDRIKESFSFVDHAISNQKMEYQKWFDQVPEFHSSNALLDRTWAYRWFIYRHSMMKPERGNLKDTFFCEGRSHKMTKTPYEPDGWEFTKLIPLSVPMHLLDLRWYGKKDYGKTILHTMRENQDEEGEFHCAKVNWHGNAYANFFGWSVWQYYLVSGDMAYAREALPLIKKQVNAWKKRYGNPEDYLLIQQIHQLTGMEYQPSYWYFHNFPEDCKDMALYTPVKRVDRNVYYYLNAVAVAHICELCKDPQQYQYEELAEGILHDMLEKMWDQETGYFYDLHWKTNEKAYVKNIVGAFPLLIECENDKYEKYQTCLDVLSTSEFDTNCPFPSVSTACPVYTAEGGGKGRFFKGRNGCVWDGPTWPFANSIILDAIGATCKRDGHKRDDQFATYFNKYTRLHYYGGDGVIPYLVEHYNSQTGECISDEVDYNHSYYIDLVVKYIVGVSVEGDIFTVDPIDIGLEYFSMKNLHVLNYRIDVEFERNTQKFSVYVDGVIAAQRSGIGKMDVLLKRL